MNHLIPIYREESKQYFVDSLLVTPEKVSFSKDVKVLTSFLKVNQSVSLLGISQNNELLEAGFADPTDHIVPTIYLRKLCVALTNKISGEVKTIILNVSGISGIYFLPGVGSDRYKLKLNFTTPVINYPYEFYCYHAARDANEMTHVANDKFPYISFNLTLVGKVNLETCDISVCSEEKEINDTFKAAIIGYQVVTHKTNNRT